MPKLSDKAQEAYIKAYGKDTYDAYNDVGQDMFHGGRVQEDPRPYSHRPDHDVESFFWLLTYALILAQPLLDAPEEFSGDFIDVWTIFEGHSIVGGRLYDSRAGLFEFSLRALGTGLPLTTLSNG